MLPFQKVFMYINVTALLERSQCGAVASLGTNPCEKLDPKAVGFGSCDPGNTHSSLSHLYIFLRVAGAFRPPSHISHNPPANQFHLRLADRKHSWGKVRIREFCFYPILTLVLGTAVKATGDHRWSGAKWYPATC